MKKLVTAATALTLIAISATFVACGGDDDADNNSGGHTSDIRIGKGLTVAALNRDLSRALNSAEADQSGSQSVTADAPAAADGSSISTRDTSKIGYGSNPAQATTGVNGITITGYGTATTDADAAIVELYFSRSGYIEPKPGEVPVPATDADGSSSSGSSGSGSVEPAVGSNNSGDIATQPGEVAPITEADLQPVIDALTGAGISADDIEFIGAGYYDPYYTNATIRATINDLDTIDAIVEAATNASNNLGDILPGGTNISYTVNDCAALERAAMQAAVEDASERGQVLAEVVGVGLGNIVGAAQYSYSPYGGTPCSSGNYGPAPVAEISYRPGSTGSSEVQVYSEITVTYAIN